MSIRKVLSGAFPRLDPSAGYDWGHRRGGEGRLLSWQLDLWPEGLIPSSFLLCSWPLLSFLPRSPVLVGSSSFKKNTAIRGSPRNFNLYRNWCLESEVSIARSQKKRKVYIMSFHCTLKWWKGQGVSSLGPVIRDQFYSQ